MLCAVKWVVDERTAGETNARASHIPPTLPFQAGAGTKHCAPLTNVPPTTNSYTVLDVS